MQTAIRKTLFSGDKYMRFILLFSITFLPCTILTMQENPVIVANKSDHDITVYFILPQGIQQYKILQPSTQIPLFIQLPQDITVHFNKLDRQRIIPLSVQDSKLIIKQFNVIEMRKKSQPCLESSE